jgi:hypothetical protein
MKRIIYAICLLWLTACIGNPAAGVSFATSEPKNAVAVNTSEHNNTSTPVPTAAPDYAATNSVSMTQAEDARQSSYAAQQAAIDARATAQGVQVAMVAFTAEYEARNILYMQATQSADILTAQSNMWTATAYPTAQAALSTQQALDKQRLILQAGMLTATKEAPALLREYNTARDIADYGWMSYFAQIIFALFCAAIAVLLFVVIFRLNEKKAENVFNADEEPYIIPMVEKQDEPQTTLRAEFDCSEYQILQLAKGWMEQKQTLAYRQWRGSGIHSKLEGIRDVFLMHEMAAELPGKRGELAYTAQGEAFLEFVYIHGELPEGWACLATYPEPPPPPKVADVLLSRDILADDIR